MTYREFINYCKTHKGGKVFVECWDEKMFKTYEKEFGKITKAVAQSLLQRELEEEEYFIHGEIY